MKKKKMEKKKKRKDETGSRACSTRVWGSFPRGLSLTWLSMQAPGSVPWFTFLSKCDWPCVSQRQLMLQRTRAMRTQHWDWKTVDSEKVKNSSSRASTKTFNSEAPNIADLTLTLVWHHTVESILGRWYFFGSLITNIKVNISFFFFFFKWQVPDMVINFRWSSK